jgi:hydroxymethylglutaryl-CoA synthase
MVGILDVAAYLPRYRLPAQLVAQSFRKQGGRGTRAVGNHDEDSLTMAATAADWCLRGDGRVDGVFFASTSAPYREKLISPVVAAVADQAADAATADFSGSLRAGMTALAAAADAVRAGRLGRVLVAAADQRVPQPGAELEHPFGAGAVAVVVGPPEGAVATLDAYSTRNDDLLHFWRREQDRFVSSGDARHARQEQYLPNVVPAVRAALEAARVAASDVKHVVLDAPDGGSLGAAAKALGLAEEQVVEPLFGSVGHTGAAHALLLLQRALERAAPGDRVLVSAYGDGVDVALLTATDRVREWRPRRSVAELAAEAIEIDSYQRYLAFRGVLAEGQDESERPFSSISLLRRSAKQDTRFYGARCLSCGRILYPIPRLCPGCRGQRLEDVKLTRRGTVFTLTREHYFPTPDPPLFVAVVDLDGGGRVVLQGTDTGGDGAAIDIGTRVEFVYRRYHEGQRFHNYYWKCRAEEGARA